MRSDFLAFQYDPGLEPSSSLTFILPIEGTVFLCVGVLAFNPRDCDPNGLTPPNATGVISLLDSPYYTDQSPRITASISASAPEPPTWMTLIAGLAFLGLVRAGGFRAWRHKKVSPVAWIAWRGLRPAASAPPIKSV